MPGKGILSKSRGRSGGKAASGITRFHYGVPVVEEEDSEVEKPRPIWWCPECSSSQTYYRSKTNTQKCRQCGYEWEREDLKKAENSP